MNLIKLLLIFILLLFENEIFCIVNKNNTKNLTTITDNYLYKPPLEPMKSTIINGAINEEILLHTSNDDLYKKRYNYINPSLMPLYCSNIPVINGATAYPNTGDQFLENTTISYSCNRGYKKTSGNEKIKCIKKDQKVNWQLPTLKCEIIKCDEPGYVENSHREAFEFTYNSTVYYKCHHGYKAESPPTIICTEKGTWNRNPPKCVPIQCPQIVTSDPFLFIEYTDKNRLVDSEALPMCEKGYRLIGGVNEHIVCQWSGKWSHKILPRCERIICKPPTKPTTLQIIPKKDKYVIGDSVLMRCLTRREKTSATCQEDGTWSKLPKCPAPPPNIITCPPIGIFVNGIHNATDRKQPINTLVIFRCNSNYFLQGPHRIYCQPNGQWTSKVPSCSLSKELTTEVTKSSPLSYVITSIIVTLILIAIIVIILLYRWRQRKLQRRHWRRYFGSYSHRQSKTNIYHNNQEMKLYKQEKATPHPVTDL